MRRAILFLNLGGPETLDDVKPFLYRLFVNPEIIRVPFKPLRALIA
jgi:ferrochelatase